MNDKYNLIKEINQYTYEIKALFEYNVRCDNLNIYPKGICSLCQRKMDRCNKALGNGGKISTEMITFQEHSDICLVCDKKLTVRPFTVKVTHSREQSKSNVKDEKLENKDVVVAATSNAMQQLSNKHLTFGKTDIENGIPIIAKSIQSKYYQSVKKLDAIRRTPAMC